MEADCHHSQNGAKEKVGYNSLRKSAIDGIETFMGDANHGNVDDD